MEDKKKIIKPPFSFSIQLFFLMSWLFYRLIQLVKSFPEDCTFGDVLTGASYKAQLLYGFSDILLYVYALVGIYKSLQRKSQSITILKFTTFYIGAQILFQYLQIVGSDSRYLFSAITILLFALFFFYVYLFKSKKLKAYIPKKERKFGLAGIVGLAICILGLWSSWSEIGTNFYVGYKSMPKDVATIKLCDGEYTDGLTIFKPVEGWVCDTVLKPSELNTLHLFKTRQNQEIMISTLPGRCLSRIDYYATLSRCYKAMVGDSVNVYELSYTDSIINGNRYYSNTYKVGSKESVNNPKWIFSALVSKDYYKIFTISGFVNGNDDHLQKDIIEVCSSVDFSLEK